MYPDIVNMYIAGAVIPLLLALALCAALEAPARVALGAGVLEEAARTNRCPEEAEPRLRGYYRDSIGSTPMQETVMMQRRHMRGG